MKNALFEISDDPHLSPERGFEYELYKSGDMYVNYLIYVAKGFGVHPWDRRTLMWDWVTMASWRWEAGDGWASHD